MGKTRPELNKECTINGIWYPSQEAAAKALNVTPSAITKGLQRGSRIGSGGNPRAFRWNGVYYKTREEAMEATGFSIESIRYRLRQGYTCDEDMIGGGQNAIPCTWNVVPYESVAAAGRASNITTSAMHYRLRQGWVCDADIKRPRGKS